MHLLRLIYLLIPSVCVLHVYLFLHSPLPLPIVLPLFLQTVSIIMYRRILTKDPGYIREEPYLNGPPVCKWCQISKRDDSFHCKVCGLCVDGFDHHCDILGICVGKKNHLDFVTFLFYHSLLCLYAFYVHIPVCQHYIRNQDQNFAVLITAVGIVEVAFGGAFLVFGLFHGCLYMTRVRTWHIAYRMMGRSITKSE